MKILLVSIPNHHFFQWVNQLKDADYDVIWFDIKDGGAESIKINWVKQIKGWKLRWDFPFRHAVKNNFPKFYSLIQKYNERKVDTIFEQLIQEIQPDCIHVFEMQLAGLPILDVLQKHKNIPLIYSSWGSDMFYFEEHGVQKMQVKLFLERVNYLITDCTRDCNIAVENGFKNKFMGVYPGNGGIKFPNECIKPVNKRNIILVKGYESFGCKASKIIEALQLVPLVVLENFEIIIYSADEVIINSIEENSFFDYLKLKIYPRTQFVSNESLLKIMGKTAIHISNNISDGMPNTLLESMGMGAFPIQSNPGNASAEVIQNGVNGYLISNPLDSLAMAKIIEKTINDQELRTQAQLMNVDFIHANYDRDKLRGQIVNLYSTILH